MLLYLRLLIATVPRMFVARRDLLIENLVLRQQLAVYARRRAAPSTPRHRSLVLVIGRPNLVAMAFHPPDRAAGDRRAMAPHGMATVLDLEEPSAAPGTSARRAASAGADPADGRGEPALGNGAHPG